MSDTRPIGRSLLTALVINCIIGSAIFGVPSEAIRLVGDRSPLAMALAAFLMATIILPVAEVASRFSEPGGLYLYARTAFGRFAGLQVGWFWVLAIIGGGAANANLFVTYLAYFAPAVQQPVLRSVVMLLLIGLPALLNIRGAREGASLSLLFTIAKLLPLLLIIGLGLSSHAATRTAASSSATGSSFGAWASLLLILLYSFSGWEDTLVPVGEVQDPERSVPFALLAGIGGCAVVYTFFQLVIVRYLTDAGTDRPVVVVATSLLGRTAGSFVAVAVMLSTYGWISGALLNAPRWPLALAREGDAPAVFGRVHPRFGTPTVGIWLYAGAVYLLAITGTFLWAIELTAGALTIFYAATCAALPRLRRIAPNRPGFSLGRWGTPFAVWGIVISLALLVQVQWRQMALMSITALLATANWWWAAKRQSAPS